MADPALLVHDDLAITAEETGALSRVLRDELYTQRARADRLQQRCANQRRELRRLNAKIALMAARERAARFEACLAKLEPQA